MPIGPPPYLFFPFWSTRYQEQQQLDTTFFAANPNWAPPKSTIVCSNCGRGPRDGVALRRTGWVLRCDDCKLPRRKL